MQRVDDKRHLCFGCGQALSEPYIRCSECMSPFCYLCLTCYASGKEYGLHENTHPYQIIRSNFPILSQNWTASEELRLLEAIEKFGLGNWDSIAVWVPNKTKKDCMLHYFRSYIYNPHPELPKIKEPLLCEDNWPAPVLCRTSDAPPRPPAMSHRCNEMAGYMPARGDFLFEQDNYTELNIKDVDFQKFEDEETFSIMMAAVEIFNSKLRERARRKCLMREYGLISPVGSFLTNLRYSRTLAKSSEQLAGFAKLVPADTFYKFLEGLHLECEIKMKINNLKEYREMGLKNFYSVPTYQKLKQERLQTENVKRAALTEVLNHMSDERTLTSWISKKAIKEVFKPVKDISKLSLNRKPAARLDILGVPGYEKLNQEERELCASLRLVPKKFLHFKTMLINEYEKCGVLKLSQARSLIKIDVNKTRKIYNYLLDSERIKKD